MAHHPVLALQPPHPSAPRVGQAIAPPPCERGIPLYPVRYGVVDQPLDREVFQTLSVDHYPRLHSAKPYGLRLLRPGSYVYLFYFQHGRMKTRHYRVTEDFRFAHLWWTVYDYNSDIPGSCARPDESRASHTVLAPETHIADTVYLLVSETLLSHATLWQIEQDQGGLRSQLTTQVKPAEPPQQPHVFDSAYAGNVLPELQNIGTTGIFTTFSGASVRPDFAARYGQSLRNLVRNLGPRPGVSPLGVALHDPVGVVSELHHLVTLSVERKTRFAGQHAHRLQSAKFIAGYFHSAEQTASTNPDIAGALNRQRKLLDYNGAMRFPTWYAKELAEYDTTIRKQVMDIIAWVRTLQPGQLLSLALSTFDLNVKAVADAYEAVVFDILGGLVHSGEGQQQLNDAVMMPPDTSPFWLAISNGSQLLADRIRDKGGEIVKDTLTVLDQYVDDYAATPATNALIGLLQALPASHPADVLVRRLRHVVEVRFSATIVLHEISLAEMVKQAREFQLNQAPGSEYLKTWDLPEPKVGRVDFTARVKVYEWIKVGDTTYKEVPGQDVRSLIHQNHSTSNIFINACSALRSALGPALSGLGGYLAIIGFASGIRGLKNNKAPLLAYGDLAGATLTLAGASIEFAAAMTSLRSVADKKSLLPKGMRLISSRSGTAMLGAVGAGLVSITDAARSIYALRESNSDQAVMYLGSALSGGVIALATWAGGSAAAASMALGTKVAVLGLTSLGWSVLALIALGVGIAFMAGVDATKHGPIDTWLKHSNWGINYKTYTYRQEIEVVQRLYYQPRLSVFWEHKAGFRIGTLRILYQLPFVKKESEYFFQARLTFMRNKQPLTQVAGPRIHNNLTSAFDHERECLVTPIYHEGTLSGWSVQLHQSAEAFFEYLLIPDLKHPNLRLSQPEAPTPLQLKLDSVASVPPNLALLNVVEAPK
ncbi:toxin VasX [Pseudomonas sp. S32]|uniref:toxin VasX n=1 Tax=Pseudomonas sp. S32 TaxID=2767448 RepID=UPI002E2B7488|nr:toxin VasX [Pseudomonas sp. S32]MBK5003668.1 hypothetical protein [Pseudomonas sp. S32]